jgi:hypothetical protein
MDHNAQFDQRCVDLSAAGPNNVHIVFAHGLAQSDRGFTDPVASYVALGERNADSVFRVEAKRLIRSR